MYELVDICQHRLTTAKRLFLIVLLKFLLFARQPGMLKRFFGSQPLFRVQLEAFLIFVNGAPTYLNEVDQSGVLLVF